MSANKIYPDDPNEFSYQPRMGSYLSSRVINHNGSPIVIALRQDKTSQHLYFDYTILDPSPETQQSSKADKGGKDTTSSAKAQEGLLDSQGWLEQPQELIFSDEIRISGQAAIPTLKFKTFDNTGQENKTAVNGIDQWTSSTLSLTQNVIDFEVISDGKYIYLFRQAVAVQETDPAWKSFTAAQLKPYVNNNLLCDRFILIGKKLDGVLEVRFRRSGQKSLPSNDKDTLGVQDMNDDFFREPTLSLRYIKNLYNGRFTVLRAPTIISNIFRWIIFAYSTATKQIETFTIDTDSDGLFNLQGRLYYTCSSSPHDEVFSVTPGPCTAISNLTGSTCGAPKIPCPPAEGSAGASISLGLDTADAVLRLNKPIDLKHSDFEAGCVLEAWIRPAAPGNELELQVASKTPSSNEGQLPPTGGTSGERSSEDKAKPAQTTGGTDENIPSAATAPAVKPADAPKPHSEEEQEASDDGYTTVDDDDESQPSPSSTPPSSPASETPEVTIRLPKGTGYTIFGFQSGSGYNIVLDEDFHLAIIDTQVIDKVYCRSAKPVMVEEWNHIAVVFGSTANGGPFVNLVINGVLETVQVEAKAVTLIAAVTPGELVCIGAKDGTTDDGFIGEIDEVRVWSRALHPNTITANMALKTTGFEDMLRACWHFDEGEGVIAYDATSNGHNLTVEYAKPPKRPSDIWVTVESSPVTQTGICRTTLRLPQRLVLDGGLHAAIYYEQVAPVVTDKTKAGDDEKPVKRNGRVLLCTSAIDTTSASRDPYLLTLDFGLKSEGGLSDVPGIIDPPSLQLTKGLDGTTRIGTSFIFSDADNLSLYGGLLAFDQGRCPASAPAPCVWESATGTIGIYFKGPTGYFSSLAYSTSKPISSISKFLASRHPEILAELRDETKEHIGRIQIQTDTCWWASESCVNLTLTAVLKNKAVVKEEWLGLPANLDTLFDVLRGGKMDYELSLVGELVEVLLDPTTASKPDKDRRYIVTLAVPIEQPVNRLSCLRMGSLGFQVVEDVKTGQNTLIVSPPYELGKMAAAWDPASPDLGFGLLVGVVKYDAVNLVRGVRDPSKGSRILNLTRSSVATNAKVLSAPHISDIDCLFEPPSFSSSAESTSLKLSGEDVLTMMDTVSKNQARGGLTFESWINVKAEEDSVICAYKTTKFPRNEDVTPEQPTFVLAVDANVDYGQKYMLDVNINNQWLQIQDKSQRQALQYERWAHVALTSQNRYALKFKGDSYVDFGNATEFNLSDFSILMNLQLDKTDREHHLLTKVDDDGNTPFDIIVTTGGQIEVRFDAVPEGGKVPVRQAVISTTGVEGSLVAGTPYRVFVSRQWLSLTATETKDATGAKDQSASATVETKTRQGYLVNIRVWKADGTPIVALNSQTRQQLEAPGNKGKDSNALFVKSQGGVPVEKIAPNDGPLLLGGTPNGQGLAGIISGLWIYGAAIQIEKEDVNAHSRWPPHRISEKPLGLWSFIDADANFVSDDTGRHHGKLRNHPAWSLTPFPTDITVAAYINGLKADVTKTKNIVTDADKYNFTPQGDFQLTLGNIICGDDTLRHLGKAKNFTGELDEFRIWDVARTREQICDSLFTRLTAVTKDLAVYHPFDKLANPADDSSPELKPIFMDQSPNLWHLKMMRGTEIPLGLAGAPVANDAACVRSVLTNSTLINTAKLINSRPGISEYGDLTISSTGTMEGSFKRLYAFVDAKNNLVLVTGFKIGEMITEWISQVQTAPTLIGYIEGAPPIPAENYTSRNERPTSAIKFTNAKKVSYSYSSRREEGDDRSRAVNASIGMKWGTTAGFGIMTKVAEGKLMGTVKSSWEWSNSKINNVVQTKTSHTNTDVRTELSGSWQVNHRTGDDKFIASNTGIALVESEVADLFALRLKLGGTVQPLVAYQMRPNPDIPKDRNLVTFKINPTYSKQGCLDGRNGLKSDDHYPLAGNAAPSDVSYYKPVEAYALRDQIRRAEEQLQGQYHQMQLEAASKADKMLEPQRTKRNICNSYVWTAHGGTFQETNSTVDFVQQETGLNSGYRWAKGVSADFENTWAILSLSGGLDLMQTSSFNLMLSKETNSESTFQLDAELPPAISIFQESEDGDGQWDSEPVKRPGAVEAYRWMSFWLEPSTEATAVFFNKVVDPKWLSESSDPDAKLLQELAERLKQEKGNARTQAWRVFHRCTYVSRVPEKIAPKGSAPPAVIQQEPTKKGGFDFAPNWAIIQALEPHIRGAPDKQTIIERARPLCLERFPSLLSKQELWLQIVDVLAAYVGVTT